MLGRVIKNRQIKNGHFLLSVNIPDKFPQPMPGQFVMLRQTVSNDPLLGRPLSVYGFDRTDKGADIELLYKVVGKGTALLSMLKKDNTLEIYGPYGNAFDVFPGVRNVVLICGGIGIVPVTFLASHLRALKEAGDVELICYAGAAGAGSLVGIDRIKKLCSQVFISTDDGSAGYHGFITEKLAADIAKYDPVNTKIYACGPRPMMKRLAEVLGEKHFYCQVSVEERMACGVGACLGCSVETREGTGKGRYMRVCKDGPVFNIEDIAW